MMGGRSTSKSSESAYGSSGRSRESPRASAPSTASLESDVGSGRGGRSKGCFPSALTFSSSRGGARRLGLRRRLRSGRGTRAVLGLGVPLDGGDHLRGGHLLQRQVVALEVHPHLAGELGLELGPGLRLLVDARLDRRRVVVLGG